ncbi:hypothetical protein BVRB_6g143320 isoform B [Beta vulgaris subsp. vulgaris]|nr:hypothetical protein BVRB_6g143320 isoform B [Beta vulgaris subsp. vulgaris]
MSMYKPQVVALLWLISCIGSSLFLWLLKMIKGCQLGGAGRGWGGSAGGECSRGRVGRGWGHQMLPWLYSHHHLSCYLCC